MNFGSVCSGIEAASVAWEPLGWRANWVAEVDPFPSAVLAHHWPDVPNLGNMLALPGMIARGTISAPDVLVGGTPCQAFSVAGRRGSLEDERGALTLAYVELANEIDRKRREAGQPEAIIVWENVPGVLNTKDNAFGCFLGALAGEVCPLEPAGPRWTNAGCVFGPERAVAWRILDAQYFGLAQRRRRVFVVASARDGFDPCEVLFEFDGVRRDTAPRRETGQDAAPVAGPGFEVAGTLDARTNGGGFPGSDGATSGHVIPATYQEVSHCLNAGGMGRLDYETESFVLPILEAGARTGKSTTDPRAGMGVGAESDPMFTLQAGKQHAVAHTVALRGREGGATAELGGEVATALRASTGGGDKPHVLSANAFAQNTRDEVRMVGGDGELAAQPGMKQTTYVAPTLAVRRLTPRECERLQGFPDDLTLVPYRNKPAADGPRYKALGNSMAVPCMRWIGERIDKHLSTN